MLVLQLIMILNVNNLKVDVSLLGRDVYQLEDYVVVIQVQQMNVFPI